MVLTDRSVERRRVASREERARRRVLGLLFLGVLVAALDIAIIGPALPAVREGFGIDERAAAWMLSIYVLFNLIGTPLMAKLSDRLGRRVVYVVDVGIFAAGSVVVALAPVYGVVLVGRAVQGLGAGGIFPVASAVIGDVFPPEKRGSALGLIGAVFGIAFLVGPILGGVLLLFGWPWLFLINVPVAVVVMVGGWRWLPAAGGGASRRFDIGGMVVLGLMLTSLAYGLNNLDAADVVEGLSSLRVWPALLLGLVLVVVFVWVERRAGDPVIRPGLLRSRQVVLACGLSLGAGLTEAAIVFVPALLVASFAVSMSEASFMLLPIVAALAVGAPAFGRWLDRVGSRVVVIVGSGMIGVGLLAVGRFPETLWLFYAAGIVIGLGVAALLGSALRYVMLHAAPPEERGAAQGLLTVFTSMGQLVGSAVVGGVIASHGGAVTGYGRAFVLVALVMLTLAVLSFGLRSRSVELRAMREDA